MTMTANGLAKLIEECGELQQIAAKKLAYFHTDEHPDGAGSIAVRLEDEMADVIAAAKFVEINFGLDGARIMQRAGMKLDRFKSWHARSDNNSDAFDATSAERQDGAAQSLATNPATKGEAS